MIGFHMHGEVSFPTECFPTDGARIGEIIMTFFLMYVKVMFCRELHSAGPAHMLAVLTLVHVLDVSGQAEPGVHDLLAQVALQVWVELSVNCMFMFDTAEHVSECVVALVTRKRSQKVVGRVVVGYSLQYN